MSNIVKFNTSRQIHRIIIIIILLGMEWKLFIMSGRHQLFQTFVIQHVQGILSSCSRKFMLKFKESYAHVQVSLCSSSRKLIYINYVNFPYPYYHDHDDTLVIIMIIKKSILSS